MDWRSSRRSCARSWRAGWWRGAPVYEHSLDCRPHDHHGEDAADSRDAVGAGLAGMAQGRRRPGDEDGKNAVENAIARAPQECGQAVSVGVVGPFSGYVRDRASRAADKRARVAWRLGRIRARVVVRYVCWLCKKEKTRPGTRIAGTCAECVAWWEGP